jgi:transposase
VVRPLLPVPGWLRGRGGQSEAYCHRSILDAVRYLVDNGIKWRAMPADFPPWDRVYAFFRRWRDQVLVVEFHDRLRDRVRRRLGRDVEPTAAVIDSQSVKADAVVGSDSRGFDGGKLINGCKRHVVVDTLGLLLGVMVTSADAGDRAAARVLLRQVADAHHLLGLVWADGGGCCVGGWLCVVCWGGLGGDGGGEGGFAVLCAVDAGSVVTVVGGGHVVGCDPTGLVEFHVAGEGGVEAYGGHVLWVRVGCGGLAAGLQEHHAGYVVVGVVEEYWVVCVRSQSPGAGCGCGGEHDIGGSVAADECGW